MLRNKNTYLGKGGKLYKDNNLLIEEIDDFNSSSEVLGAKKDNKLKFKDKSIFNINMNVVNKNEINIIPNSHREHDALNLLGNGSILMQGSYIQDPTRNYDDIINLGSPNES